MDTVHEQLLVKQIQQNDIILQQNQEIIRLLTYIAEEPEEKKEDETMSPEETKEFVKQMDEQDQDESEVLGNVEHIENEKRKIRIKEE